MDVTEYFLPPGRHLLDACGDSGFDTSVDGLAVLFSQRAEGATDAGFQGRVKKVGKGGWVLGGTVAGKLDIQGYIYTLCRVYFDCFKGVNLGRHTRHRKKEPLGTPHICVFFFKLVNMKGTIQSSEAPEQSFTESVSWWEN